uniref:Uncharacterized protein n=1 Tax=Anguilla anguilla TaxID=7936 RepID=A0A0E9XC67_ANGAN
MSLKVTYYKARRVAQSAGQPTPKDQ